MELTSPTLGKPSIIVAPRRSTRLNSCILTSLRSISAQMRQTTYKIWQIAPLAFPAEWFFFLLAERMRKFDTGICHLNHGRIEDNHQLRDVRSRQDRPQNEETDSLLQRVG